MALTACELIQDRPGEIAHIRDVAKIVGVHAVHLARAFRTFVGCTPGDLLRARQRLGLAASFVDEFRQFARRDRSRQRVFRREPSARYFAKPATMEGAAPTREIIFGGLPTLSILHHIRVIPSPAQAVVRVMLQNRAALHREFRELILYPCGGSLFTVWESVGFASDSNAKTQYQLRIGSKSEMQVFLKSEVERLCDKEDFTMVEGFTIVR